MRTEEPILEGEGPGVTEMRYKAKKSGEKEGGPRALGRKGKKRGTAGRERRSYGFKFGRRLGKEGLGGKESSYTKGSFYEEGFSGGESVGGVRGGM